MRYHVSRSIDAPAQTVWDLLTDASTYKDWNPAVISIEGPIATGNTIKLVSVVNPKRTFSLKVTEMQQPARRADHQDHPRHDRVVQPVRRRAQAGRRVGCDNQHLTT